LVFPNRQQPPRIVIEADKSGDLIEDRLNSEQVTKRKGNKEDKISKDEVKLTEESKKES
jgi:hypothetical protein